MKTSLLVREHEFKSFLSRALEWTPQSELSASEGVVIFSIFDDVAHLLKTMAMPQDSENTSLSSFEQEDVKRKIQMIPDAIRILRSAAPVFQDRFIHELTKTGKLLIFLDYFNIIAKNNTLLKIVDTEWIMKSVRFTVQFIYQLLPCRPQIQLNLCDNDSEISTLIETMEMSLNPITSHTNIIIDWCLRVLQTAHSKNPAKSDMYERCLKLINNKKLDTIIGKCFQNKIFTDTSEGIWLLLSCVFGCSVELEESYHLHPPIIQSFISEMELCTGFSAIDCYDIIQSTYDVTSSVPCLYEVTYLIDKLSETMNFNMDRIHMDIDRGIPPATQPEDLLEDENWKAKLQLTVGEEEVKDINELFLKIAEDDCVSQFTLEEDSKKLYQMREEIFDIKKCEETFAHYETISGEIEALFGLLTSMVSNSTSLYKKRCCEYGIIAISIRALLEHLLFEEAVAKKQYTITTDSVLDNSASLACNVLCLLAVICDNNPWGQDTFRLLGGIPVLLPFMQLTMRATYRECCATLINTLVKNNPVNWGSLKRLTERLCRPISEGGSEMGNKSQD